MKGHSYWVSFCNRKRVMEKVIEKAYGKINLSLDVLGRRDNGYHDVSMIMQTVDVYDTISLSKIDGDDIRITANTKELPLDENNIVYKATRLMKEEYGIETGVSVHIEKEIPISAGMGGGSADAAATLRGMNRLFNLGLKATKLEELGLRLGADVPFLIRGGISLAEGIGERLTELVPFPECAILIVKPNLGVSTKEVYENFDSLSEVKHPNIGSVVENLGKSQLCDIVKLLGNVLEEVTVTKHRIISEIKQLLLENGAVFSMMTGSGPTVFGIFESEQEAEKARLVLKKRNEFEMVEVTKCRYGQ